MSYKTVQLPLLFRYVIMLDAVLLLHKLV